ncbi:hypothetical protein Bbelb_371450 [Branchiostoma belcheri]|nr:hypothetical protein Bbelb_371450 [Branchiostoma belcheri]
MAAPMDDSVPGDNKEPASWTTVVKRGATKETRSVKIGTHWARVFYDGQVQEPAVKTPNNQSGATGIQSVSSPQTEATMEYIDNAFDKYVNEGSSGERDNTPNLKEGSDNECRQEDEKTRK